MLYFDGGDDLVEGGKAAGRAYAENYEKTAYHGPKDEFNPNWRWDGIQRDLDLYYAVGRTLASSNDWPNWKQGDEFRAIRDKSRGTVRGLEREEAAIRSAHSRPDRVGG
jgi:Zn-dependent M28 family amino/carboxypeptidase